MSNMMHGAEDYKHGVIHCSATKPSQDVKAEDIDRIHKSFGWNGIGYSDVIERDGTWRSHNRGAEFMRPYGTQMAHIGDCSGRGEFKGESLNLTCWGVCMVGGVSEDGRTPEWNYTDAQIKTLTEQTIPAHWEAAPASKEDTCGHRDMIKRSVTAGAKACPSGSVESQVLPLVKDSGRGVNVAPHPDLDSQEPDIWDIAWREFNELRLSFTSPYMQLINKAWAELFDVDPAALTPDTYTIKEGDTLWSISKRYGVPVEVITNVNNIRDPHDVRVGRVITLHKGTIVEDRSHD